MRFWTGSRAAASVEQKMVINMIFKILLIIMLVLPVAYLAITLLGSLMDEVLAMGKKAEKKAEEDDDSRYRRPRH